jgi:hypothetical protein
MWKFSTTYGNVRTQYGGRMSELRVPAFGGVLVICIALPKVPARSRKG